MRYIKNKSELEIGETYVVTAGSVKGWIIRVDVVGFKDDPEVIDGSSIYGDTYFSDGDNGWGDFNPKEKLIIASDEQKRHLKACIDAGKFIPAHKIKIESYGIY